jgi:hypothetical protein
MGAINVDDIRNEFFDLWTAKVKSGLTPSAGLEEIRKENPDLYRIYQITVKETKGGNKNGTI